MEINVKINIFNWGCVLYYINFIRKLLSFVLLLIFVSFFIFLLKCFFFGVKLKEFIEVCFYYFIMILLIKMKKKIKEVFI